jgi:hypothetical protein
MSHTSTSSFAATMAWPAPVPVLPLDGDQTRFELLDATTPNDLEGSNFLRVVAKRPLLGRKGKRKRGAFGK